MKADKNPTEDLRNLLTIVSDHGKQHLVEIETDLMQTNYLLGGAIEKLGASFMAIHETVVAQQLALDQLLVNNKLAAADVETVLSHREKLSLEVNSAVTGLQFQDMTSQLITRVLKHVNGLKESLEALESHGDNTQHQDEHFEITRLLEDMCAHFGTRNDAFKHGLRKSVAQHDMDSGDIELF